ncbi:hypothetical protein BDV3_004036 [Batrachochytrium dendrobatidis]|nr:hypothetical protein O5D80_002050 [Batrachochytrium dendrobatidis]KAK5669924.1 hypothetical protein QVD99_004297 [Batrachochytrium dendrobatidis]
MAAGAHHNHHPTPYVRQFVPPKINGRFFTKVYGAACVFFIGFRIYHDGGHHFLNHHPWEEPKMIAYLEKVDKKYGSHLATSNMHH